MNYQRKSLGEPRGEGTWQVRLAGKTAPTNTQIIAGPRLLSSHICILLAMATGGRKSSTQRTQRPEHRATETRPRETKRAHLFAFATCQAFLQRFRTSRGQKRKRLAKAALPLRETKTARMGHPRGLERIEGRPPSMMASALSRDT